MKKILQQTFVVLLMAVTAFAVSAQEFSIGDLTYKVLDTSSKFVEVSNVTSSGKTKSTIEIPGRVSYSGTDYRVYRVAGLAFQNLTSLTTLKIRLGVDILFANAFQGCSNLATVYLPSSIAGIRSNTFSGCSKLKTVYYNGFNFPNLGVSFPSNSGMTLYISNASKRSPSEYKSQSGWSVFSNVYYSDDCYDEYMRDGGLYSVGYSDNDGPTTVRKATLVGYKTSGGDTQNGTVYKPSSSEYWVSNIIPFSIDTIGTDAFHGQTSLKTIDLTNATKVKYIGTQSANTGVQNVTKLVLPPSNFSFNTATFINFASLTTFELASGSSSFAIYDGCLYNYSKTTLWRVPPAKSGGVGYPNTLSRVWSFSHGKCTQITSAYLPYGVKTVESNAFNGCSALKYIKIPSSVTSLSNSGVFNGINASAYVYVNMQTPPTITADNYFGTHSNIDLYVPYGRESAYSSAGWTGFYGVNRNAQAYDIAGNFNYTVTSTASTTANDGSSYGGRVKVVWGPGTSSLSAGTAANIPASVSAFGKTFAVTKIGEDAFNNNSNNFTVTGCVNVDTIGAYAFQNQPVTAYAFTHKLKRIDNRAFEGSGLTGTVQIPYGVRDIGIYAFANGKYERIVVPSGVSSYCDFWCNTSTLKEIVYNSGWHHSYTGWDFTGVPSTCYIRVPTGYVQHFKNNSKFSGRTSYVTAGAYDFSYNNAYGNYFLTILSTSSTTYGGTTYAGKAKYVYHPNIQNNTGGGNYGFATAEEDRTVSGDIRNYLITEIGDSLLYGSKFTGGNIPAAVTRIGQSAFRNCAYAVSNLVLPSGLTFIGHDAFYQSKITGEVKVPTTVTTLEDWALCASTLGSLYFPDMNLPTMGTTVWSSSIGKVWVPNHRANDYLTKAKVWGNDHAAKINVYIKPTATTTMFSSVVPVNLSGSNIDAYYASNYDKNQTGKEVTLTKANQAPENTGLLLVDLTANQEYRISRPSSSVSAPMTNYFIGNPSSTVNVNAQTVGYYWDANSKKFVDPSSTYNLNVGMAYLKLSSSEASGKSEVYTSLYPYTAPVNKYDISGNGTVGVEDVNIVINVMLGKDTVHKSKSDVSGNGTVGVEDVNAVINAMLGK
ncbi:MAG: leucine-rich repeat protein [Muribaculaceae bacterium]|nr:leucine-rich repeat protein [Muribaculaceae bacterium]